MLTVDLGVLRVDLRVATGTTYTRVHALAIVAAIVAFAISLLAAGTASASTIPPEFLSVE